MAAARHHAGLTVVGAAEEAKVSPGTIRNAERGSFAPRADALARMADAYGVQIDSLFVHEQEADMASTVCGTRNPHNSANVDREVTRAVVGASPKG